MTTLAFHVSSESNVALIQLQNGKFQKTTNGDIEELLTGHGYVLVKNSLAKTISDLEVQGVTFKPATLWDRKTDVDDNSYEQMFIEHTFSSDEVESLPLDGNRFFLMDDKYVFVTPGLMKELSKSPFQIEFSLGLSEFG